jgi:hypothetical protein
MKIPGKNIGFAGSGINANLQFGIGGERRKGQSGEQDQASQKVSSLHIALPDCGWPTEAITVFGKAA